MRISMYALCSNCFPQPTKKHFVFVICVNVKGKEVIVIPALIIFLFSYNRILIYDIHSMIIVIYYFIDRYLVQVKFESSSLLDHKIQTGTHPYIVENQRAISLKACM